MTGAGLEIHEAIWHDVECGTYTADLTTWTALAREATGPVLELGSGTGRVALHLAREGFDVTCVDASSALTAELRARAVEAGLEVEAVIGDARALALGRRFALVAAPMQFVHLMGGAVGRERLLRTAAAHLAPGGRVAMALLGDHGPPAPLAPPPLPDVLERAGWVYSSLPIEARDTGAGIEVRRLRQLVSPTGSLREQVDSVHLDSLTAARLEAEAGVVGLTSRERIEVPPTLDHVGSTIVVLEAA